MTDLPLIFVGGLLGSAHCLGMCGPLALTLGAAAPDWRANLRRQGAYSLGRVVTYACGGAAAGVAGRALVRAGGALATTQAWLAIVAGVALVLVGLSSAGLLPRRVGGPLGGLACAAARQFKSILAAPGWSAAVVAGMLTGFLPCGLVYAFLLKAISTASGIGGAATMLAFGLGTVPAMVLAGSGGQLLSGQARWRLFRAAAWCVVVAGAMTCGRGAWQLAYGGDEGAPACPLCAAQE